MGLTQRPFRHLWQQMSDHLADDYLMEERVADLSPFLRGSDRVKKLIIRDGDFCWWCGHDFLRSSIERRRTVDHVMPLSLGGRDYFENVVLCCDVCNHAKANDHPLVWIARLVTWDRRPPPRLNPKPKKRKANRSANAVHLQHVPGGSP